MFDFRAQPIFAPQDFRGVSKNALMLDLTKYTEGYPFWFRNLVLVWFVVGASLAVLGVFVKQKNPKSETTSEMQKESATAGPNSQSANVTAAGVTVIQAAPHSTVNNRPGITDSEIKLIADAVNGPRPPKEGPKITESELNFGAVLMPSWSYPKGTVIGGIVFEEGKFDIRFNISVGNITLKNLDLTIEVNRLSPRKPLIEQIAQLSNFPGVTFFPSAAFSALGIGGIADDGGREIFYPASGNSACEIWRLRFTDLIPNATYQIVIKAWFLESLPSDRPKALHLSGVIERNRPDGGIWRYQTKGAFSLKE